jgi:hypothetical protein
MEVLKVVQAISPPSPTKRTTPSSPWYTQDLEEAKQAAFHGVHFCLDLGIQPKDKANLSWGVGFWFRDVAFGVWGSRFGDKAARIRD